MELWIDDVVAKMHRYRIKQREIAKAYGCSREHIGRILNGKCNPPKGARERIEKAIDDLIANKS